MDKPTLGRRQLLTYLGLGGLGLGAAISVPRVSGFVQSVRQSVEPVAVGESEGSSDELVGVEGQGALPEFQEISDWLNSDPLTVADLLGSVVLIQFWTFACINCQRTLPSVVGWDEAYRDQGLKVVGIHTPEFAFERDINNVREALTTHNITYPVPLDNGYKTWKAYSNRYWPHLFLADRQGVVRYDHIGEGAYDETERMIQQLLG
jgi:thiol-disulfide isomerase/thioredoxin